MRSTHWRLGLMLVLVFPILAAGGCTGSDPLAPQTQVLTVNAGMVNPDPVYEVLAYQLDGVIVRPQNPDADQSLDAQGINLLARPIEYLSIDANPPSELALTNGGYTMERINMSNIQLINTDPPRSALIFVDQFPITAADYGSDVFVSVENGATNQFNVVVDATALAIAFQAAASVADPQAQPDQFAAELAALSSQYLILE